MEKFIVLIFLISSAIVVCSARVFDQVNPLDDVSSISNVDLERNLGSPVDLSTVAGENGPSNRLLNRQKRFLRFRWVIRSSSSSGSNGNGKHAKQK